MNVANVGNFNSDNGLSVNNWNRDNSNSNIFAAPLEVSSGFKEAYFAPNFVWLILSILQACGQFLEVLIRVLGIFCFAVLGCLLRVLREF
jgi:hypothetical protein